MATSGGLPPPTFDLESWASNYTGPLLPLRLQHVAVHCPALSQQALTLALQAAKAGKDVTIYKSLVDTAERLGLRDVTLDQDWIGRQDDGNKRELSRLEGELRGYKNNLIRESIRMGQEDLATHLLVTGGPPKPAVKSDVAEVGQLQTQYGIAAAYSAFGKMREYCTTPTHIAGMTLRLMFTALVQAVTAAESGSSPTPHFVSVNAQAARLATTGVKAEEEAKLQPICLAAKGISLLGQAQYRDAAICFSSIEFSLTTNGPVQGYDFCRTSATANDIAIYGGLTALATMSREELEQNVLDGDFRAFLELEPHMRKAITLLNSGKYRASLDLLFRYYSDWSLDIYLSMTVGSVSHVDRLLALIREKSMISYFASFSQVSLQSLAETFPSRQNTAPSALEDELIAMIQSGRLKARLDIVNGVLHAPKQDRRLATHTAALAAAHEVERTLLQRLFKINISLARLELPPPPKGPAANSNPGWAQRILS